MNCRTAEEMVNQYMNHTLSIEEMEEFLDHIQSSLHAMTSWKRILLFTRQCSSLQKTMETRFLIFVSF